MTTTALTAPSAGAMITGDLLTRFADFLRLNVAEGDASPETLRAYYTHVRGYTAWCNTANLDPATATYADLVGYRKSLVEHPFSKGTVARKVAALRRFYEAARSWGMRQDNPAEGLKAPADHTAQEERIKFLPLASFKKLLAAPQGDAPRARRDRAMIALMGYHGLRVAEVAGLVITDYAAGDLPRLTIRHGKGDKRRDVYLVASTTKLLDAWLQVRKGGPGQQAIFTDLDNHHRGEGLKARAMRYLVDGYLGGLGLKAQGVSCHSLRHSCATWALYGGAQLLSISQALGHSSTKTTEGYAKIVDRIKENPALYLETLLAA